MKTRIVWIAAIFTIIAVIVVFIFRDPTDIQLVRGVKPINTQIVTHRGSTGIMRTYSLHVPYDEAVRRANDEIPTSWSRSKNYKFATFISHTGDNVTILHARLVTNIACPVPVAQGDSAVVSAEVMQNVPDSDDWTTVTTIQTLIGLAAIPTSIKKNLIKPAKLPYQLIQMFPKSGVTSYTLPMNSSTTNMTGSHREVEFYDGTD